MVFVCDFEELYEVVLEVCVVHFSNWGQLSLVLLFSFCCGDARTIVCARTSLLFDRHNHSLKLRDVDHTVAIRVALPHQLLDRLLAEAKAGNRHQLLKLFLL